MARSPVNMPKDYDYENPMHMIFWLDANIGQPNEYHHVKNAFASITNPHLETFTMLTDKSLDYIIRTNNPLLITFESVHFGFQAFNRENDCLRAFENNQDKRIFFITSGSLGQNIVPKILKQYRHIFTDRITNKPYTSIYVFCKNIELHINWAMDYAEYIQIFDFDSDLLERMTRDIAEYFIQRGIQMQQDNRLKAALLHLHWAKKLWHRYDRMLQNFSTDDWLPVRESKGIKKIDKLIQEIEGELMGEELSDYDDA